MPKFIPVLCFSEPRSDMACKECRAVQADGSASRTALSAQRQGGGGSTALTGLWFLNLESAKLNNVYFYSLDVVSR